MYALINVGMQTADSIGTVLSTHRTVAAAERADAALQRTTRRGSGPQSYVMTRVVKLIGKPEGRYIADHEWTDLSAAEVAGSK